MYGKQTECAIAALSRLAEVWDGGQTRLSATEIADSRGLRRPFVAKILSALSQAGLVIGSRGPGGGCALARDPKEIKLYEVYKIFERADDDAACPFGGGICGTGEPCPLHEKLVSVQDALDCFLHETTFDVFRTTHEKKKTGRPSGPSPGRKPKRKRASYRATRTSTRKR